MKLLSKIFHTVVKRDVVTRIYTKKFKKFGKNTVLYTPLCIREKKNISIGDNTTILSGIRIQTYNDLTGLNSEVIIGDDCYIAYNNTFLAGGNIIVENGVLFASNILISSENHSINPENNKYYMDQELECNSVCIGEGTWIGEKVCILPGVMIGKKCVIGAGSIVTKSVPDHCIVVGSPAKVIKNYNFETHKWEKV